MSSVKNPAEKKRLDDRDHYNRNGESNKAWRKAKPIKKAKARRAYRKAANDLAGVCAAEDTAPVAAVRKKEGLRQRRVTDWGAMTLRDVVASRQKRRESTVGARKKRQGKHSGKG